MHTRQSITLEKDDIKNVHMGHLDGDIVVINFGREFSASIFLQGCEEEFVDRMIAELQRIRTSDPMRNK